MSPWHSLLLVASACVILTEAGFAIYYWPHVIEWLSHNLWVVLIPFAKAIVKKLIALNFFALIKALVLLFWHLSKLLLLKLLKTLSVRYGVFFSQNRWYWIRRAKVMFLRRGKQYFRAQLRFWLKYDPVHRWLIAIAFFPFVLLLFFLGLSFNITRKTMVQKAQESALFEVANSARRTSRGLKAWVSQLDEWVLKQIRDLTPRATAAAVPRKPPTTSSDNP